MARKMNKRERERREAKRSLAAHLKPGTTVYTVLRHVSKSGMLRRLDVYTFEWDAELGAPRKLYLTYWVARLLGYRHDHRLGAPEGMHVQGCGMDMGYHVVNSLSYAMHGHRIHGRGYCGRDAEGNRNGVVDPSPQCFRVGYSLNHEWI